MDQTPPIPTLPLALADWITITEVENGSFFAGALFTRKLGGPPPEFGRHIVVFYRREDGAYYPLSYLHFWRQDRIGLIGGACTDGRVMRLMTPAQAQALNAAGGMLHQTSLFAFSRFEEGLDAFFCRSGDTRARKVLFAAVFCQTSNEHLLIKRVKALQADEEQALFEQAMALGSF